jgi:[ribosomal protein S5]-alanine N-acetyltransferase
MFCYLFIIRSKMINIRDFKKKIIKTKRLKLIPFSLKYKDFFYKNSKDKQTTKYTTIISFIEKPTMEDVEKYIRKSIRKKNCLFYVILSKETNIPIGCIALLQIDLKNKNCFTFSWLNKKYVGKGYMYEAKKRLISFAFNDLKLRRIQSNCDINNKKIQKHLISLGFKKEGILRKNYKFRGRFVDDVFFALLKEEFKL